MLQCHPSSNSNRSSANTPEENTDSYKEYSKELNSPVLEILIFST